jgi:hypothetical protein
MDMILDADDTIVNLGDISIANLTYDKTINDVAFNGHNIYVATDFGLVVYDDAKKSVLYSGIYGVSIKNITVAGPDLKYLVVCATEDKNASSVEYYYYVGNTEARLNTFDKYKKMNRAYINTLIGTETGFYEYNTGEKSVYFRTMDWANSSVLSSIKKDCIRNTTIKSIAKNANGDRYFATADTVVFYDIKGDNFTKVIALPSELKNNAIDFNKSLSSVWAGDGDGIANYDISDGSATVLVNKMLPSSAITCDQVAFIHGSKDGSRVYISNIGNCGSRTSIGVTGGGDEIVQRTDVLINGEPKNAAVFDAEMSKTYNQNRQKSNNNKLMYDPDCYYMSNAFEGVFVVKDNKQLAKFNNQNAPFMNFWDRGMPGAMCFVVNFDPEGNLWVGERLVAQSGSNVYTDFSTYLMLPKEKLKDLSSVQKSDWQYSAHKGKDIAESEMKMVVCEKSNYFITWSRINPLGIYNTKGTYGDTSDDEFFEIGGDNNKNLKDTDGNSYVPSTWLCGVEDKNGEIWFGSTLGVAVIPDPTKVTDASYQVTRPKVPRNDGTIYADYLLESEQVNAIAVDSSNCKWIGTENSGLYYVSEDGSEIIEHFTTENSPLPTNAIQSLYCAPNDNTLYVGLPTGLMTYGTSTISSASTYDSVLAYPNPVRPDYTGWITITGLMENSLVKIADASGNVLYSTRSNGGMATWDGCNNNGERVSTGVYFVLASQNENDNSSAVVTKIMVIK